MKHLNRSGAWPSGNARYYYRPKGQRGTALPDLPIDHPGFITAYNAAAAGTAIAPPEPTGTIGAAVVAYLRSDKYLSLAPSTRDVWRRQAEDIRRRYGMGALDTLRAQHIRQDLARLRPHPANTRLKVWRALGRWWVDAGLIEADPARDVRRREAPATDGHMAWTRADFATFRAHWQIGTPERLAFELMHQSCAAIGDAVTLGPRHIQGGWLVYRRRKSGTEAACPWTAPAPAWFEASADLWRCLDAAPLGMTYITTRAGLPRGHKGAAAWFSRACTAAGLPDLSAHGIRKGRAAIFRENGASEDQRMAILGHETSQEARRYSKAADLTRIISGTEKFQLSEQSSNSSKNG